VESEILRTTAQLDAVREVWQELDRRDPASEFYTTWAASRAWWEAFGRETGVELRVIVATHNGATVGILPLALETRGGKNPRRVLRFAGHGDWMGPVAAPSLPPATVYRSLITAALDLPGWDLLDLDNIRRGSPFAAHCLADPALNPHFAHRVEHPVIGLRGLTTPAQVPKKARKYRARAVRELGLRFTKHPGDTDGILDRLARLHRLEKEHLVAEHGRSERHSWSESPARLGHYQALFAATETGAMTYCYETGDGRLLAARSTFRHRYTLLSWTSAYHPDAAAYRLGKALQLDILDDLIATGEADFFDFGAGRYPWKFEWTDAFDTSYRRRIERPHGDPAPPSPAPATPIPQPEPLAEDAGGPATANAPARLPGWARSLGAGRLYWSTRRALKRGLRKRPAK